MSRDFDGRRSIGRLLRSPVWFAALLGISAILRAVSGLLTPPDELSVQGQELTYVRWVNGGEWRQQALDLGRQQALPAGG